MTYVIGTGEQKDILAGDLVQIVDGLIDGVDAVVVADVSSPDIVGVIEYNFETLLPIRSLELSSCWITAVWRPI